MPAAPAPLRRTNFLSQFENALDKVL